MPWQRLGLTGPRTVQTVRDSPRLQSLKSKHTAQMKAELPFPFGRREEVLPSDHHLPFLPASTASCCSVGLSSRNPPSPPARRNPTFPEELPRYAREFLTAHLLHSPRADPCPRRTHTASAKPLQPMYTYVHTYTRTDTQAQRSTWPNTPRKTQDCPLCPWVT